MGGSYVRKSENDLTLHGFENVPTNATFDGVYVGDDFG